MQGHSGNDRQALVAEAARIRAQVKALKQQWKQHPDQPGLREEVQRLTARYRTIDQALATAPAPGTAPAPAVPGIDPARLEHKPIAPLARKARRGPSLALEDLTGYLIVGLRSARIAVTGVLLLFVLTFGYLYFVHDMRFFIVPTRSMQPTLLPMDRIATTAAGEYRRGDIVVFPDPDHPGDYLAKRIVALGGELVSVHERTLFVNNRPVLEPYIAEPMDYRLKDFRVPAGQVFVLGDNRNQSEDSKDWGRGVPTTEIQGRAVMVYMPFQRFHYLPGRQTAQAASR